MKHVVLFSGGANSAYVAYLIIKKYGKQDVVLLHTPTLSENHDADTFRYRVARYLKVPITEWGDGLNLNELIENYGAVPGQFMPFCTQRLKQEMKEQYYKYLSSIGEDFVEYIGFGIEKWNRGQKALARAKANGREVRFPIFEEKIKGEEIKRIIQDEWKISLPEAYKRATEHEERFGYTVFKGCSLKELHDKFQNDKEWDEMQLSLEDWIPCECWT